MADVAVPAAPEPAPEQPPGAPAEEEAKESEPAPSPAKEGPAKRETKQKTSTLKQPATPAATTPASGSRERKKVVHYKPEEAKIETKKVAVSQGKGSKLRDIPNVHFKLQKITGKDELMELLHDVLYKRKGQQATRKRDILDFSGWTWDSNSKAAETEKAAGKLGRLKMEAVNQLLDIFELPRGTGEEGHKDAKVQRIIDWLQKPTANSEKNLADQAAKKKAATARKREKESAAKDKEAQKKAKAAGKEGKQSASNGQKRKAKGSPSKPAKKSKKAAAEAEPNDDSDDDELPLGTVAKLPTDEALVEQVEAILQTVDVQEFNLKALMARLAEHYGTDMTSKKPLIKVTAIKYCMANGPAPQEENAEEEEEEPAEEEPAAQDIAEEDVAEDKGIEPAVEEAATAAAAGKDDKADDAAAQDDM